MSNYYFVQDCTEPEMIVAKSYYEWEDVPDVFKHIRADKIYELYDHLKRNQHLLRGNNEENTH